MAESNSRWPAYARVPPFLPVPLRAGGRMDAGAAAPDGRGRLRPWLGQVIALHRGKSLRSVDFPKRKVTPEELAKLATRTHFTSRCARAGSSALSEKPSVSALLRHLRRLDAFALSHGWEW